MGLEGLEGAPPLRWASRGLVEGLVEGGAGGLEGVQLVDDGLDSVDQGEQ